MACPWPAGWGCQLLPCGMLAVPALRADGSRCCLGFWLSLRSAGSPGLRDSQGLGCPRGFGVVLRTGDRGLKVAARDSQRWLPASRDLSRGMRSWNTLSWRGPAVIIVPNVDGIHDLGVISTLLRPAELEHPSSLCHSKVNSKPTRPVCCLPGNLG